MVPSNWIYEIEVPDPTRGVVGVKMASCCYWPTDNYLLRCTRRADPDGGPHWENYFADIRFPFGILKFHVCSCVSLTFPFFSFRILQFSEAKLRPGYKEFRFRHTPSAGRW